MARLFRVIPIPNQGAILDFILDLKSVLGRAPGAKEPVFASIAVESRPTAPVPILTT
jgi:hypothetical protein